MLITNKLDFRKSIVLQMKETENNDKMVNYPQKHLILKYVLVTN